MTARMHGYTLQHSLKRLCTRLGRDESGQDLVEYALVATALGLFTVVGVHGMANSIHNDLNIVLNGFKAATGQP